MNIFITQIYGLTETYGPSVVSYDYSTLSHIDEEQQFDLLARQGHPCNFVDEIRVISQETGKDVALNSTEVGEICFSGNLVSGGYYRNEEATKNAYRDGLFWTGDLAVRHPDGAIEVVDRSKDMILSGAENISSLEVEATVLKMDNIMEW